MAALFPFAATTEAITVRVAVTFQPESSQPAASRWFWVYHIRIENHGDAPVQLRDRRWEITDGNGAVHVVEGSGVVGEQPVIAPGASFDYVSGCPLNSPSGHMVGHFGMIDDRGRRFTIAVPDFPLLGAAVSR
ncbi:MAG: Co2+/Mg2+ efflux protein ApaG [Sphingopyxis sp.]